MDNQCAGWRCRRERIHGTCNRLQYGYSVVETAEGCVVLQNASTNARQSDQRSELVLFGQKSKKKRADKKLSRGGNVNCVS